MNISGTPLIHAYTSAGAHSNAFKKKRIANTQNKLRQAVFTGPALMDAAELAPRRRPKARYERLTFWVLAWSWGLLMAIILGVHFYNYSLETKTSSKSPTHSGFYEVRN